MLADSVTRLFAAHANAAAAAETAGWQGALWSEIEELGIPSLLIAAEHEGFGGTWEDAYFVLHACGLHQVPLPVAEAMLAARLASDRRRVPPQ
jgi:acyl-CoA dehydrogenase